MLTDTQIRKAAPQDKDYKLGDSGGLYLFVTAKGAKIWRMKYRYAGKEHRLIFGRYPEVSLAEARDQRDEARQQLRRNANPAVEKRKAKITNAAATAMTFEKVARAWHEMQAPRWAPVHAKDVITSLERDVFPDLGALPIRDIDAPTLLGTLRKVEKRGAIETAKRLRQRMSGVFVYAISEGIVSTDPAAIVTKALKPLPKKGKQPAITVMDEVRQILVLAEASGASPVTKLASRLLALTAVRPGVVRGAGWDEYEGIDWETGATGDPMWRVPPARMKLLLDRKELEAFEHLVPLSTHAVDVLLTIRRLTGRARYVFPNQRHTHQPLSENAIGYLYNRVGYHGRHVPHGWRAAFSTILNDWRRKHGRPDDREVINLMLAHVVEDKVEGAYNRAAHMDRRVELAQIWADMLMEGLEPASSLLDGPRR